MATINIAADKTAVMNAIKTCAAGDVIKVDEGVVEPFFWPANTTKKFTITGKYATEDRQPRFRGISINSANGGQYQDIQGDPKFETCTGGVVFDGIHFDAKKLTTVKQSNTDTNPYPLTLDAFGGYGWRVDFSTASTANLGENAGMLGLAVSNTCDNITLRNCVLEGFANALNCGTGVSNITVEWCKFIRNCEDFMKLWGLNTGLFQYNWATDFRGLSYKDAHNGWGWGSAAIGSTNAIPPHSDYFQFACNSNGQQSHFVKVLNNYLYDNTCRVHGVLMNNAFARDTLNTPANFHTDLTVTGNEFRMTHTTAMTQECVKNLKIRGNKVFRLRTIPQGIDNPDGSKNDTKIAWGGAAGAGFDARNVNGTCDVSNNTVRKLQPSNNDSRYPNAWTVELNDIVNDDTAFPDNWQHIRKDKVTAGQPFVGPYGQGGTVIVTPGDALQDVDFNMIGAVPDPAFPSPDTRMTGVLEIPTDSIAFSMPSIWWGIGADAPLPTVFLGTTTSGAKLYRLNTAAPKSSTYHLAAAGAYLGGILCYYKDADGVMSNPSAVTSRFNVPSVGDRTVVFVKPR